MKVEQLELGIPCEIRVRRIGDEPLPAALALRREVWLGRPAGLEEVVLRRDDAVVLVEGATRADAERLEALLTTALPQVCWILDTTPSPGELLIQILSFPGRLVGELPLAVDDKAIEDARRAHPKLRSARDTLEWLADQCLLRGSAVPAPEGFARAFLSAGTGRDREGAFAIHGRTMRAFARRVEEPDGKAIFLIEKIVRGRGPDRSGNLFLAEGNIAFVDRTVAARVRMDVQAQIAQLGSATGGLIDLWTRYGNAEGEAIVQRARKFGVIHYDACQPLSEDRVLFTLPEPAHAALNDVTIDDELEAAAEPPAIITTVGMSWIEYEQLERATVRGEPRPSPFVGAVTEVRKREGKLALRRARRGDELPVPKGVLFISILGDRTRLRRRRTATESIRDGLNPMCQLRLLLEDGQLPLAREGRLKPLTPEVRHKIFGPRGPTKRQEDALRIALNTPDLALIQGPPGTGKTTVITALVERLNAELDSSAGIAGHILLSGYQHDAVENAIARMSVNGLPPIKFGARGGGEEDLERTEAALDRWCQERATKLRARLTPHAPSALDEKLAALMQGYLLAPTASEQTATMLAQVANEVAGLIPASLLDELRTVRDRLSRRPGPSADRELLRLVRALRTVPEAFADDGARCAHRLLRALQDGVEEVAANDLRLLERSADWLKPEPPDFLADLVRLRRKLLLRWAPITFRDSQPKLRHEVLAVLARVRDALAAASHPSDAIEDAGAELLAAYEGDPEEVKRAILGYMAVYAATCQQSERLWSERKEDKDPYDTVIVDEAARANPLDLFIPMAQAGRRIVLVGDHRQLPHVLDRQLEFELEKSLRHEEPTAAARARELLGQSLFQRLFSSLQQRHERGEVQRTVTLDAQYRMHPTLGKFVSREFYEPDREGFESPLPALQFAHSLPGYAGPAAWLDAPRQQLGFEVPGESKSRPEEAELLIRELKRLIDHPAAADLNFGVITFYAAQRDALRHELHTLGMVDKDGEVIDPYRDLLRPDGKRVERLRYGTVDAFQGMEFDVVFLSMVRCNDLPDGDEIEKRRKYGHLMSPNRLCVSMSRQKRLLIIAGDAAMLREPAATAAIGPLVRFYQLCEEIRGGKLR